MDRVEAIFDDSTLVANAGLVVPATLMVRLGLESLINATVRLVGRVGGALPGRKILTLVATILAGGSHIDHADVLRAGATQRVLPFRVMAPSTLGTFLRAFTFGHVRQLDKVIEETIRRAWRAGAGPDDQAVTIDLDSTIVEVHGKQKHGAAFGHTKVLGYHPLLATRADSGEILHARLRKGSSQRGAKRFVEEPIAHMMNRRRIGQLVTVGVIGGMTLLGGLAAANALPGFAQGIASDVLGQIGVTVPGPDGHAGTEPGERGRSDDAVQGETSSSSSSSNGKGTEVSNLARTTPLEGVDKGAAISAEASDGKSQAGQSDPPAANAPAETPTPPVEVPSAGGTGTADTASGGSSDQGTGIADSQSDGHSSAGAGNAADGLSNRP
jgi:hypothetical protein